MTRIVHVTTVPMTLQFLTGLLEFLRGKGVEVHAVAADEALLREFAEATGVTCHGIAMTRRISPLSDALALWQLFRLFRTLRPEVVHAHTPKGGMLAVVAGRLARVPAVAYTIHGLPFATASGWRRLLLKACELISCRLAHRVFCVSASMEQIALLEQLASPGKLAVIANGSIGGIDCALRFNPARSERDGRRWRSARSIPADAFLLTFIGRLTRDKGVFELHRAWQVLRERNPEAWLTVVGPRDTDDPAILAVLDQFAADLRVRLVGLDWNTPPVLAASDVLCLPTYREGFPVTLLEAAAMAVPVVATSVPGCTDAVEDGVTGSLVPARDAAALAGAVQQYIDNPRRRIEHGAAARARAETSFRPETIWAGTFAAYVAMVGGDSRLLASGPASGSAYAREAR